MRYKLERKCLFNLVKNSFQKWVFNLYIYQLKTLDKYNETSYTFNKWNSDNEYGTLTKKNSTTYTYTYPKEANVTKTLTAEYTTNTVTTYESMILPDAERTNYKFTGWKDSTGTYHAGTSYSSSSDVTLIAQWAIYVWYVDYRGGNVTGVSQKVTCKYDDVKCNIGTLTKKGYTQKGWSLNKNASLYNLNTDYYVDRTNVDGKISKPGDSVTVYAFFEALKMRVTYHFKRNGRDATSTAQISYGDSILSRAPHDRDIKSWYTKSGNLERDLNTWSKVMTVVNIDAYARY